MSLVLSRIRFLMGHLGNDFVKTEFEANANKQVTSLSLSQNLVLKYKGFWTTFAMSFYHQWQIYWTLNELCTVWQICRLHYGSTWESDMSIISVCFYQNTQMFYHIKMTTMTVLIFFLIMQKISWRTAIITNQEILHWYQLTSCSKRKYGSL